MKTKLILLFILTLIIGFIIGWLTSAQVRIHKLQPVRMYLSDNRFREGFYKVIQPDEKQKEEIDKILDRYAKHNAEFQQGIRKDIDSSMKAFRKELDAKLTKEQLSRLKDMDERRQEMIRQGMKHREDSTYNRRMGERPYDPDHRRGQYSSDRQGPPPPPAADSLR